jgi:tRNA(fMet)-specific endonuclease VapC
MVVLDTDHMSILEREQGSLAQRIRNRLSELGVSQCATTIISYEEQMRGWLGVLAKAKTLADQVVAYQRLKTQMVNYSTIAFKSRTGRKNDNQTK